MSAGKAKRGEIRFWLAVCSAALAACVGLFVCPASAFAASEGDLAASAAQLGSASATLDAAAVQESTVEAKPSVFSLGKTTYTMQGDAVKSGNTFILTKADYWQGGGLWIKNRLQRKEGLTIKFQYKVTGWKTSPLSHADGIMLNIAKYPSFGGQGEELGFVGDGAYGVELDSYQNYNDPDQPHVAIVKDYVSNHLAVKSTPLAISSKWRTVTVTYKKNTLTVKIGSKKIVSKKGVKLPSKFYVGLTASTGDGYARQAVRYFKTNAKLDPVSTEGKLKDTKSLKSAKFKTLKQVRKDYKKSMSWATRTGLYVPGVDSAAVDGDICKNMVPQGITVADDYLLVTAYCKEKSGKKGVPKHDSVLYVMDKHSGELLTTLALKGTRTLSRSGNHVGGITYDGYNIAIATSGYLPDGKNIGELMLTIDDIVDAVEKRKTSISTKGKYVALPGAGKTKYASFNVYYGGYLWIGHFIDELDKNGKQKKGTLTGYWYNGEAFEKGPVFKISDNANGAAFFQVDGNTYLLVNKSTGRYKSTKAYSIIYSIDDLYESADLTQKKHVVATREVPRMMEEVCYDSWEDTLYMLTESAAKEYRGNGYYPTNVIFAGSPYSLIKGSTASK